jgi:hypothetical protein
MRAPTPFAALIPLGALAAATLALPPAARAEDPKSTTDIRCIVVSGTLASSDDPELQSLGRANLFYFMGRLEGRGDTDNLPARIADAESKMTADDMKAQAGVCNGIFTAAMQSLQAVNDAIQQRAGGTAATPGATPPAGAPAGSPPPAPPKK